MATPQTAAFHTLGCKLNFSETSSIRRMFEDHGYGTVEFSDAASVYVINTCSVTEFADKKCRYAVRKAQKNNPDAKIVVIGCYAQLKPTEIAEIPGVDLVLGAAQKFRVLDYIDSLSQSPGKGLVIAGDVKEANSFHESFSFGDRTRTFLKVQDGCDYKCTFCTIPLARGNSRSNTVAKVIENTQQIADKGVKEIVLTGVNLGDFGNGTAVIEGLKPKKEALFVDLIRELDGVAGIERFRISSIEPNLLTKEIIDFVAQSKRFVPHFHIPLQSGSNEILANMKRRYRSELYRDRIDWIRQRMPDCCIGVDVIVGFPGETNQHFLETKEFIQSLDINYLHVFTYSERANTSAADMLGKVNIEVRRDRNAQLRNLSALKKREFYRRFVGVEMEVLIEKSQEEGFLTGFTANYLKVQIEGQDDLVNSIQKVKLESLLPNGSMKGSLIAALCE